MRTSSLRDIERKRQNTVWLQAGEDEGRGNLEGREDDGCEDLRQGMIYEISVDLMNSLQIARENPVESLKNE